MSQRSRQGSWVVAALAVIALATGGCSGGSADDPVATAPSSSPSAEPAAVTTQLSWGRMAGRLPQAKRQALALDLRAVVDGWMDAAYLGGDYPRTDFSHSWPGFTAGAQAQARRDGDLMSNRDIGASIDGVEAEKRDVALDVLTVKERPVGVTARVALRFSTTGSTPQVVRVAGRLYLTRGEQGWQVFGYDVRKDAQ
jgi:hypothetical protein